MHLEEMVGIMVERIEQGQKVVRVHTGDPAMYGAIMEQIALVKKQESPLKLFRALVRCLRQPPLLRQS